MNQNWHNEDVSSMASEKHNNRRCGIRSQQYGLSQYSNLRVEDTSSFATANPGDIIELKDGTRKKYNGTSWRRLCSRAHCSYYTQCEGLCKLHLTESRKRNSWPNDNNTEQNNSTLLLSQEQSISDDMMTLSDSTRKIYDNQQNPRICSSPMCTRIISDNQNNHNSFCSLHNDTHVFKSPSHKRRRLKSPASSLVPSQVPMNSNIPIPMPKPTHRLSIAAIPPSVDINHPKKGDIIEMENGSRKKFDGVVWRKICSLPNCFIAAQRDELCRKHYIKLNGKPNDANESMTVLKSSTKSISSISTSSFDENSGEVRTQQAENEFMNENDDEPKSHDTSQSDYVNHVTASNDDEYNGDRNQEISNIRIDPTLIDALSTGRHKFLTDYLKEWLRQHPNNPYPSNQEKFELAKQSSITYDQVNTWFNNARALLRRRQAKVQCSFDVHNDEGGDLSHESKIDFETHHNLSSQIHQSLTLFNGLCSRSIGIQCSPSTANQVTSTSTDLSTMNNEELLSDHTVKITRSSSQIFKRNYSTEHTASQEFPVNDGDSEELKSIQEIIITSTCLDDHQMALLQEFSFRFNIKYSNIVDEYTTHLITDEEGETLVCPLSKKVIQAVARHMYVLTYRWINTCLEMNKIINEKPFEIQGDLTLSSDHHGMQRSRQSALSNHLPKCLLFEKFFIMLKCNGCQEMLNSNELIELVKLSGAKYTTESYFSRLQTNLTRIVLCEKEYLINRKEIYDKCISIGVHFLTPEWFLESLVQYRIQPFQDYQISP